MLILLRFGSKLQFERDKVNHSGRAWFHRIQGSGRRVFSGFSLFDTVLDPAHRIVWVIPAKLILTGNVLIGMPAGVSPR